VFACTKGPGSFTGVRIGAATIKGLAFGKNKTVIGVSTLEALAENALPLCGILCPVMNARRGQVYNALFRSDGTCLTRLTPDRALSIEDLEAELLAFGEPVYPVGDGVAVTTAGMKEFTFSHLPTLAEAQNAVSVAAVARREYEAGVRTTDTDLSPVYLRLPQAERERLAKENKTE
jgi:tRNA threonylcarbamoyladenosine biosynthesis protein TsaB